MGHELFFFLHIMLFFHTEVPYILVFSIDRQLILTYNEGMSMRSFRGGVHPPEKKDVSSKEGIRCVLPSTKMVWIPITQGGAPNEVQVKVGDKVAKGQLIASSKSFVSAPVHSSVSGVVKKIEPHLVVGGQEQPCVCIQLDGEDRLEKMPLVDPFSISKEEAIARIKMAGITGMGGASFPTHVKLSPPPNAKIEYVIANGAECEPYLCIDAATMMTMAKEVVDGLSIVMKIESCERGIIAIEANKKYLVPILKDAISSSQSPNKDGISIEICKTKYPQGGEKTLVKALLGREIPSGGLPFQIGCIIQNVGTLKAISDAFRLGLPLIERSLTISGGAVEKPMNIVAPIGTCIGDLIPEEIKIKDSITKIISGGPMMGFAMKSADFPIQKNTSGVLFLTKKETSLDEEDPCIGCARCVASCSCMLSPVLMVRALKVGNLDEALKLGLMDCVECGACSYICPAHIKLVQRFRIGKQLFRLKMAKKGGK